MLIKNKNKKTENISLERKELRVIDFKENTNNVNYAKQAEELLQDEIKSLWGQTNTEILEAKEQAQTQSRSIIQGAQREAEAIITQAHKESEDIKTEITLLKANIELEKQELEQIISTEKQKAFNQGLEEAKPYINDVISILKNFNKTEKDLIEKIKTQITSIGFDIAKLIIGEGLNDSIIQEQVKKSIEKIVDTKGIIQIYINESDNAQIPSIKLSLEEIIDENTRVLFKINNEISPGSCQINTQAGRLDANFSTQLKTIKVILEKHFGHKIDEIEKKSNEMESQTNKRNIKLEKAYKSTEPSDIDLEMIEDEESGNLVDLVLDEDINNLVEGVMVDKKTKEIDKKFDDEDDVIEVDWDDSDSDDEDDEFEEALDEEEIVDEEEFDEIDEDFDEEEEEEEEESDPRYPEY